MTLSADLTVAHLFDFRHHIVLVTGGATGLGEIIAQAFVQNGARVFIASRKEPELKKTCHRLNQLGPGSCEYFVADLKDRAGCDALCAAVKSKTPRLTVLVNNSGATWGAPYDDFPESGWDKIMALNVKALYYTTAGLHAPLTHAATAAHPSRVINIASVAGLQTTDPTAGRAGGLAAPGTGTFSYGPSKAAALHLTRLQSSKLMPQHVTANAVCPGVFPTRMTAYGLRAAGDTLRAAQPSGRVGEPADLAGTVLFLASHGAAHLTGNIIELDGGSMRSGSRADAAKL